VYDNGRYYDSKGNLVYDGTVEGSNSKDLWDYVLKKDEEKGRKTRFTNVDTFINKTNNVKADYYDTNNLKYDGTGFYEATDDNGNPIYLSDSELSGYAQAAGKSLGDFKNGYVNGPTAPVSTPNAGLHGYMKYLEEQGLVQYDAATGKW
jgi:hypothetical protein